MHPENLHFKCAERQGQVPFRPKMSHFFLEPRFPTLIREALATVAGRRNATKKLSNLARLLLSEYVRALCVKNPRQAVRISNETLEAALGVSARTIQRAKSELVEEEWIIRNQIQSRKQGMQISDVTFTEKALIELGLVRPKNQKTNSPAQYNFPDDLKILVTFGMKPWQIFSLIRLANKQKARLGDIVACVKDKFKELKNIYGYIKAVITKSAGRDWEVFRSYKEEKRAKEAQSAQEAEQKQANPEEIALEEEKKANFGVTLAQLLELKKSMPQGAEFGSHHDSALKFKHDGDGFYFYQASKRCWARIIKIPKLYQLWQDAKLYPLNAK